MSIQVTFTTEQFENNAATILSILKGEAVAAAAATDTKAVAKEEAPAQAAKKAPARKAPAKTAAKEEPKVSIQEAKDALIKVKDDESLGIAEARRIMKEAGVPDAKLANLAQEHAEKVLQLSLLLLDGGNDSDDEEDEEDL